MGFRQDRALLKVGWCPEPEMDHFNASVVIVTKGRILDVYNNAAECFLITFGCLSNKRHALEGEVRDT